MVTVSNAIFDRLRQGLGTQDLAAVIAIAQHRSISKAAQEFNVTTGGLSQRLKAIENLLGVRIFQRSPKGVALNSNGEAILPLILDIAQSFAELADRVQEFASGQQSVKISISCPQYFGERYLQTWLMEFLQQNTQVKFHLNMDNATIPIDAQQFDLLFRAHRLFEDETLPPYDVSAGLVMRRPLVTCCAPSLLKADGPSEESLDILSAYPLLDMKFASGFRTNVYESAWRLKDAEGQLNTINVQIAHSTNNAQTLKCFALAGLGIAMIPVDLAAPEIAAGRLVPVLKGYRLPDLVIHLLHHVKSLRHQTRELREFIMKRANQEIVHRTAAACA